MARLRARRLQVEPLEGKRLLSTLHYNHIVVVPKHAALVLDGDLKDPSGQLAYNGDMSRSTETFSGRVQGMGAVSGAILNYNPYTTALADPAIVLTNARGSVTLSIQQDAVISQTDTGLKTVSKLPFTVQSGTGAYANASGAGVFTETQTTDGWNPPKVDLKLHTTRSR